MAPATVKPGPAMTTPREGQAAVRLNDGRVLMMGGAVPFVGKCAMTCLAPATASVEVYDPRTGKFSHNGSLAAAQTLPTALLLKDGRVLVVGTADGVSTVTMEIYDPATGKSAPVEPPANGEGLPVAASILLLAGGEVLMAGGSYDNLQSASDATLIFDPTTGAFTNGPSLVQPREWPNATLLNDGRLLIFGGGSDARDGLNGPNNMELIDPSNPFLPFKAVHSSHEPDTSTLLSDGRVLVTESGPRDSPVTCFGTAVSEVFDPTTEKFTPVGPMNSPRVGPTMVRIPDGRVIVVGGVDTQCRPVTTVEAFDPGSETFQVIATGFPEVGEFTVTLLADGRILIAGGMTAATWLLKP